MKKEVFRGIFFYAMLGGALFMSVYVESLQAASPAEEVRIGAIFSLSGAGAEMGQTAKRAIDLGVREFNKAGGIKNLGGAKLKVIYGDNRSIPEVSVSEAERLIGREKVSIITGAHQSALSLPVSDVTERYKTPYMVSGGAADPMTEKGYKYVFRQGVKSSWARKDMADMISQIGKVTGIPAKTVAITFEDSDWGQGAAKAQRVECEKAGLKVVLYEGYPSEAPDLSPLVIKLKGINADALFMHAYMPDAIQITKLLAQYKVLPKGIFSGGGGMIDPNYLKAVGPLSNYVFSATVWSSDIGWKIPKAKAINSLFEKEYGVYMGEPAAYSYTALEIIVNVLERTKSLDKEDIRRAFAATDLKVEDTIAPYPIVFGPEGQNPHAKLIILQMKDQKMHTIWPNHLASPDYKLVWPLPPWEQR